LAKPQKILLQGIRMTKSSSSKLISAAIFAMMMGLLLVGGCKGPVYPNCTQDSQCKVGPNGEELSGVCVMGKCEECAVNSDCKAGSQCVNNVCMKQCAADGECGAGSHCEEGLCHKNCDAMNACGAGRSCDNGRCVTPKATSSSSADHACSTSATVHFEFDKFDIKSNDNSALDQLGMCLRQQADVKVVVEGNTDERGSTEYNIALGNKRADSVRKYLTNSGVSNDRMKTVSFGKEKPVDRGHSEEAWAKNRRSDIKPQ
jgi:peptidoglycan-associated lipoprotein